MEAKVHGAASWGEPGANVCMSRSQRCMNENNHAIGDDATTVCDLCGRPGAVALGGRLICSACYEVSGSCCTEFQETDEDAERIKRIAREVGKG